MWSICNECCWCHLVRAWWWANSGTECGVLYHRFLWYQLSPSRGFYSDHRPVELVLTALPLEFLKAHTIELPDSFGHLMCSMSACLKKQWGCARGGFTSQPAAWICFDKAFSLSPSRSWSGWENYLPISSSLTAVLVSVVGWEGTTTGTAAHMF